MIEAFINLPDIHFDHYQFLMKKQLETGIVKQIQGNFRAEADKWDLRALQDSTVRDIIIYNILDAEFHKLLLRDTVETKQDLALASTVKSCKKFKSKCATLKLSQVVKTRELPILVF